ncbi:hypothetical protein [Rhizobium tumorigenes]|uniref:hypothetical protein n=1 Tax=Rhizobium tumorigenes TaxID=2041385 RepID=UPI00241DE243|nr:hypothetical protein [Rhizobium tumorigenes]WFS02214.1 hypothetical protein PR016_06265 [Rhizobium tumorigenes]
MAARSGPLKSSANAGQLSRDLGGKVGIKQYYNGALRMIGFEPIPQSGFGLLPGSAYVGSVSSSTLRKGVLKASAILSYVLIFTAGQVSIWRNDRVHVATIAIPSITAGMLPDLGFYGEADTFGVFHPSLTYGIRLLRDKVNDAVWTVANWPFASIPDADLGGVYAKTDDKWVVNIHWAIGAPTLVMSFQIDGATSASAQMNINPDDAAPANWAAYAASLQAVITAMPGFGSGVSVTDGGGSGKYRTLNVTFGGSLAGDEYDFTPSIVNTSDASALASHIQIGATAGEPLISASRGGFAGLELYQDRAVYYAPAAETAALAQSQPGEYFNLNIKLTADNAPRLDRLRSQTSETIRHVLDNTYLLIFTDQAEWFASNRTVTRNDPMNFVRASEIGVKANCRPAILEGDVYFFSPDGGKLYSISYDAVSTTYVPASQNDLNKDLVANARRQAVQRKIGSTTSARLWILREDGRLVCCVINKTQEIMAACEWPVAGGGLVKDMVVDGLEQVWITVDRGGVISEEILEEQDVNLFQMARSVTTDLTGRAAGLGLMEGKTVWAEINADIYGPFVVSGGFIDTGVSSAAAKIGIWAAPVYESMPFILVKPDDTIVRRPGAVKSAKLYLLDTTSIAIGANGRAAKDVPLNLISDDLTLPKVGFSGHVPVLGLIGATMDPTIVITQTRPGRLRLRDYIPGTKL